MGPCHSVQTRRSRHGHDPSQITNPPPSGFFAGASHVDAHNGIFTDASVAIAGDVNISVKIDVRLAKPYGMTANGCSLQDNGIFTPLHLLVILASDIF
jgi:hypothetical protein